MNPLKCGTRFLISSSPSSIVLTLLIAAIGAGVPQIDAEFFGISIDNTCKTLLKNNQTTVCPTYEDIITFFPDTSTRKITGEFGYYNGIYQRLPTKLHNSFEYYSTYPNSVLFIDPPNEQRTRINMIEIKANLKEYKLPKAGSYNTLEHSLTLGHGRYVDKYCDQAYIDASEWIFLVGDTLKYMAANCDPTATHYNSTTKTYLTKVTHDITTSYKWKLEQWQKKSLLNCGNKVCLYVKNQTAPP